MAIIGEFTLVVLAEKKMICIIIDYAIIATNDLQKLYEWLKYTCNFHVVLVHVNLFLHFF